MMARTPVPGSDKTAITAFLVTPDMPGFPMIEPRMPKLGIRGTATGRFALRDVQVPKENVLGPLGKGLRVALTVLDFGRTTFGACCTGAAKTCLSLAVDHANTRRQFNKTLGDFHLVQKKIARIAAEAYAMEAMTTMTASLIDRGLEDYMMETAMLKVFTTERLWDAVNESSRSMAARRISSIAAGDECCATRASTRSVKAQRSADFVRRPGRNARTGHGIQGNL